MSRIQRRLLLLVLVSAVVFVTVSAIRMTYQRFQLGRTLSAVEQEIVALEEERSVLTNALASFDEFSTIEQAAREVLNLQREGEQVIILLPTGEEAARSRIEEEEAATAEPVEPSNAVKWWAYFFGEQKSE